MWGWGRLFWEEGSTIWLRQVAKECWVIDDELDRIKLDRYILQLCELRADSRPNGEGPYLMSGCGEAKSHSRLLHFVRPH
jgi:hypothetical protein